MISRKPPNPKKSSDSLPHWAKQLERGMMRANDHLKQASPLTRKKKNDGAIPYASFNDRVFAVAIDIAILTVSIAPLITWLFNVIYGANRYPKHVEQPPAMPPAQMIQWFLGQFPSTVIMEYMLLFIILGFVYLWCWNKAAATPGKWLLRMRIVDQDNFCKPSPSQLFWRYASYLISVAPMTIGCMWALANRKHRTWHDIVAGTVVVKVKHWRWYDDGTTPHVLIPLDTSPSPQHSEGNRSAASEAEPPPPPPPPS